jgi:hypothetical protein
MAVPSVRLSLRAAHILYTAPGIPKLETTNREQDASYARKSRKTRKG